MNGKNNAIAIAALCAAFTASQADAAISVEQVSEITRPASSVVSNQLSGITWAGGNLYYAVDDTDKKLYPLTIAINRENGAITTSDFEWGTGVVLSGASDAEGCAYDPASGTVWVSDEGGATIREYNPTNGDLLRTAPVPSFFNQKKRGNFSLESLTISGDGYTMWTANEEALTSDGPISTNTVGCLVRLTKFTRSSVYHNWTHVGQWAYRTDPFVGSDYKNGRRSGVADLLALPDGSLFVLEREMSCKSSFFIFDIPSFRMRLYKVDSSQFSPEKDVSGLASLPSGYSSVVSKGSALFDNQSEESMANWESICLGPCLNNGAIALVLVSDAGSSANSSAMTMKLSGLTIRTINFTGHAGCEPSGSPYRYVNNASVTATLPGAGNPYETNLVAHASWSLSGGRHGEGSTATFNVTADETFTWSTTTNTSLPLVAVDSFERIAVNTEAGSLDGWSGDGVVAAASYSPSLPPGCPLSRETHEQVLKVDGDVTRTYDTDIASGVVLDTMVCATRPTADSPVSDFEDGLLAFHFDEEGHPVLQHRDRKDAEVLRRARTSESGADTPTRTVLSENTYTNGQWLRLTVKIVKPVSEDTVWCHVSIDGEACVTTNGACLSKDFGRLDKSRAGAWYRSFASRNTSKVTAIDLKGTGAVDDVTLYTDAALVSTNGLPEFNGDGDFLNGVTYRTLWENGLPFDADYLRKDSDGDSVSNLRELQKGTDPWDRSEHPTLPTMFGLQ